MVTKIFLTGATGYIGGSVFHAIATAHPEYDITVLLRNVPDGFSERYPNVKIIRGDYDSADILTNAAAEADIVIHNGNSDHVPSLRALLAGLLRRQPTPASPAFLIHLSGTGITSDWRDARFHGVENPKVWSDLADAGATSSSPADAEALHGPTEVLIREAWQEHGGAAGGGLRTAVVRPPDLYGRGRGPGRTASVYMPTFVHESARVGAAFYAGEGANRRTWLHVEDLMPLYLKLVEAAARGGEGADWGADGYYFADGEEVSQIEIARAVGKAFKEKGIVPQAEPKQVSIEQLDGMISWYEIPGIARYLFASNSRSRGDRSRKVLGWRPQAPSFWETLESDLADALAARKE